MAVWISMKSSNTIEQAMNMPFYRFRNFVTLHNRILEREKKAQDNGGENSPTDTYRKEADAMLRSAKRSSSFKPKLK